MAQVKVDSNGHIGLATNTTDSNYEVLIDGDLTLTGGIRIGTTFNGAFIFEEGDGACILIPESTNNSTYIGLGTKQVSRIYGRYIYANQYPVSSDKRLKENFQEIISPLDKILNVKGLKYDFIASYTDSIKNENIKYKEKKRNKNRLGILAQDLQLVIPEAVVYDDENDMYYIDYNAITPVIIEAMKEQQAQIEELKNIIKNNEIKNIQTQSAPTTNESKKEQITDEAATLNQNIPNPFNINTNIEMYIPSNVNKAILYIYNMQGNQIASYSISEREYTSITIEGNKLDAGMYLYTLITDGQEVDTKRMILTK